MEDHWFKLSKAITDRRDMVVSLTQEMIRRPSQHGEGEVQKFVAEWWRERGIEPDIWDPQTEELANHPGFVDVDYDYSGRPNVVVFFKGKGGGHSLTLNGHTDVVPVEPVPWEHGDPFGGQYVDEKIYGRGSVDMKGGLALGMIVIDALLECGIRLKGDLQMQFVVDEENGGNGTLAAIQRGYRSDATIFIESTAADTTMVSSRGAQFFRIIVPGVEGGIEYQAVLPNAIQKANLLFQAVEAFATWRVSQADHPLYAWDPTKIPVAICKIQAGSWPSTFPAQCVMEGSLECMPGEDIDQVKEAFRTYLLEASRKDAWLKEHPPVIEWFGLRFESGETSLDHPFIHQLTQTYQGITGHKLETLGGGGSDLRLPVLYADSASVLLGPTGGAIHATDEYVDVDSLMQMAQVVGKLILDWCEVEG